jgi:hypothetical protein
LVPDKQRQRPWDRARSSVDDAVDRSPCFAFGEVNRRRRRHRAIDIPPTRFWRFSPKNAIVLEVLLKEQEAQIVAGAARQNRSSP